MKISEIADYLDSVLSPDKFDDVSNNGIQIENSSGEASLVAFAVDASLDSVRKAAEAGAGMLVVHHGISWNGGIKRIAGGVGAVVRAAVEGGLALYASHLPLDANPEFGNNALLAKSLGLDRLEKAFRYHGNVIGLVGYDRHGRKTGVSSGGSGMFAPEAKKLGCERFVTGEADWGEIVAAENEGIEMVLLGHYETETFGVKALCGKMRADLGIQTVFIERTKEK